MIKYNLLCAAEHEFEGWFRDSADYDAQAGAGMIECPTCGSADVRKAIMAPAIAKRIGGNRDERLAAIKADIAAAALRARDYVEKNFDNVGDRFPEEARKIHYGEAESRGIYGQATGREVKELIDEGVEIAPLPGVARSDKAGAPKIADKSAAAKSKLN